MIPREVNTFVVNFRNLVHKIYNLNLPVIAAIDGVALGKLAVMYNYNAFVTGLFRRWFRNFVSW